MICYRPVAMTDPARPAGALPVAGGPCWFDRVEVLERGRAPRLVPARDLPPETRDTLADHRPAFAGLAMDRPRVMGILNVTPDSFSDGGRFLSPEAALAQARALAAASDMLDIGGESTRPGAAEVSVADEIARTAPVIAALREAGLATPVSIDTRKAPVANAALQAGAQVVNDVAAFRFDPALGPLAAARRAPVVLMHSIATPATMQDAPAYDDVVLDVYAALAERIAHALALGIPRANIMADPGIGFGKTLAHNLALLARLSVFHGLGVPILLGASRKRFIGTLAREQDPDRRLPGSLAVALHGAAQGVQIIRVHDAQETAQALRLWRATTTGEEA
ncbi:dihydropteroate synthase [Neotabrizicola shimadae]|uniref:Dihydropteroate synthase n=1 Tax=Neotabrizicola shimadae TaxID=2807096 RepID=A0A8G0ZWR3_9RHOB|nr:dihydropteroate synthase [Neotabrizicola shimadae]QYZ71944.1 dihydropteroate synthase [Neotabrizicola shimadae]